MKDQYSFCESTTASIFSPWHIRKLTSVGRKLGGGADTAALCGRKVSWDLETLVENSNLGKGICKTCTEIYRGQLEAEQ